MEQIAAGLRLLGKRPVTNVPPSAVVSTVREILTKVISEFKEINGRLITRDDLWRLRFPISGNSPYPVVPVGASTGFSSPVQPPMPQEAAIALAERSI